MRLARWVLLAAVGLLLTGCAATTGGGGGGSSTAGPGADSAGSSGVPVLSNAPPAKDIIDPCTLFSARQLRSLGLEPDSREPTIAVELGGEGCGWDGDRFRLSVGTLPNSTAQYRQHGAQRYDVARPNTVHGRPGVLLRPGPVSCFQVVAVGSTSFAVHVGYAGLGGPQALDECAVAHRAMQMIEPELSELGSAVE